MRPIDATRVVKVVLEERDKIPLEVVERYSFGYPSPYKHGQSMRGGIRKVLRIIEQAPTLDLAPKWISVDEEYPEDLKLVLLAYADNGYVDIGYYDESFAEWDDLSDSKILRPTHWMPLPLPPKEGS
jgi:hypothetical protein